MCLTVLASVVDSIAFDGPLKLTRLIRVSTLESYKGKDYKKMMGCGVLEAKKDIFFVVVLPRYYTANDPL